METREAFFLEGEKNTYDKSIQNATTTTGLTDNQKVEAIKTYVEAKQAVQKEVDAIGDKNNKYNKRLDELKSQVPAALQQKAKDCAKEVAPVNLVVNLVVQGLAIYYTGGLSLMLPSKALYIDMGEVVHGNIGGG